MKNFLSFNLKETTPIVVEPDGTLKVLSSLQEVLRETAAATGFKEVTLDGSPLKPAESNGVGTLQVEFDSTRKYVAIPQLYEAPKSAWTAMALVSELPLIFRKLPCKDTLTLHVDHKALILEDGRHIPITDPDPLNVLNLQLTETLAILDLTEVTVVLLSSRSLVVLIKDIRHVIPLNHPALDEDPAARLAALLRLLAGLSGVHLTVVDIRF